MPEKTSAESHRTLRIAVPEALAEEIRRIAAVSRRSAQSVANVVLGNRFDGLTPENVQDMWLEAVRRELGAELEFPEPAGEEDGDVDR